MGLVINGDLTVDAPNATVNNYATVSGNIIIEDISANTWNELASTNSLVFKAKDKTLVIRGNVRGLDIQEPTNLVTQRQLSNVTIAEDVVVTVRPTVNSTRTTTVTGGATQKPVIVTPPAVPVVKADLTAYNEALGAVTEADHTNSSWETYQGVVVANVVTANNKQAEVDAATAAITEAQKDLVTLADYVARKLAEFESEISEGSYTGDWDTLIRIAHFSGLNGEGENQYNIHANKDEYKRVFESITSIDLSGKTETTFDNGISTGVLVPFTKLETLNLSDTGIKEVGGLAGLTELEELNISGTSITDLNILVDEENDTRFTKLRTLHATNLELTSIFGLTHIAGQSLPEGDITWNLEGSVLTNTEDNISHLNILTIRADQKGITFTPPTITGSEV